MWKAYWEMIKGVKSPKQWKDTAAKLGLSEEVVGKTKTMEDIGRLTFMQSL